MEYEFLDEQVKIEEFNKHLRSLEELHWKVTNRPGISPSKPEEVEEEIFELRKTRDTLKTRLEKEETDEPRRISP